MKRFTISIGFLLFCSIFFSNATASISSFSDNANLLNRVHKISKIQKTNMNNHLSFYLALQKMERAIEKMIHKKRRLLFQKIGAEELSKILAEELDKIERIIK